METTPTILSPGSYREHTRIGNILRLETVGGLALMAAALIAVIWANSPWAESYFALRDFELGWGTFKLSLGTWAADGLLAIFFFLVGLELKNEFVNGDLRNPSRAAVPMVAAFAGVAVPSGIFALINAGTESISGWAIPAATDIAFAVAVLAIIGSHLPSALRLFLLTLAVVDDLIAITIIAIFYTESLNLLPLALFFIPVALYAYLVQRHTSWFAQRVWAPWLILLPLGIIAWGLLFTSGIHATIAGVVLGFVVPVKAAADATGPEGQEGGLAMFFEYNYRPISAGLAVPLFAFFSAGVAIGGFSGLAEGLKSPVALGVLVGLVAGKPIGITLSTFLLTKFTRAHLDSSIRWIDLIGVGALAGIGFTVSLLIGELSFGLGSDFNDAAKIGILMASVVAALLASMILVPRNRHYKKVSARETTDSDADGVPDAFDPDPQDPATN